MVDERPGLNHAPPPPPNPTMWQNFNLADGSMPLNIINELEKYETKDSPLLIDKNIRSLFLQIQRSSPTP